MSDSRFPDEPNVISTPTEKNNTHHQHTEQHSTEEVVGDVLHGVGDAITGTHAAGIHVPRAANRLGMAAAIGAEILHNSSDNVVEGIVCGASVAFIRESANIALAAQVAVASGVAASAAATPVAGAAVAGAVGIGAYRIINQATGSVAIIAENVCHAGFELGREQISRVSRNDAIERAVCDESVIAIQEGVSVSHSFGVGIIANSVGGPALASRLQATSYDVINRVMDPISQIVQNACHAGFERARGEEVAAERQRQAEQAAVAVRQRQAEQAAAAECQRQAEQAAVVERQRQAQQAAVVERQRQAQQQAAAQRQRQAQQQAAAAAQRKRQAEQAAEKQRLKNLTPQERCYQTALGAAKKLPECAEKHYQLARAAFYKKRTPGNESMKFKETSKECDKALALDPKHAGALKLQRDIGETNLSSNSQQYYRSALIAAKNLTGADKDFQLARVALFKPRRTRDQWEKYEEAAKECNQALKLNPKHAGAVQLKNNVAKNNSSNNSGNRSNGSEGGCRVTDYQGGMFGSKSERSGRGCVSSMTMANGKTYHFSCGKSSL